MAARTPEDVAANPNSYTGGFLAELLEAPAPKPAGRRRRRKADTAWKASACDTPEGERLDTAGRQASRSRVCLRLVHRCADFRALPQYLPGFELIFQGRAHFGGFLGEFGSGLWRRTGPDLPERHLGWSVRPICSSASRTRVSNWDRFGNGRTGRTAGADLVEAVWNRCPVVGTGADTEVCVLRVDLVPAGSDSGLPVLSWGDTGVTWIRADAGRRLRRSSRPPAVSTPGRALGTSGVLIWAAKPGERGAERLAANGPIVLPA